MCEVVLDGILFDAVNSTSLISDDPVAMAVQFAPTWIGMTLWCIAVSQGASSNRARPLRRRVLTPTLVALCVGTVAIGVLAWRVFSLSECDETLPWSGADLGVVALLAIGALHAVLLVAFAPSFPRIVSLGLLTLAAALATADWALRGGMYARPPGLGADPQSGALAAAPLLPMQLLYGALAAGVLFDGPTRRSTRAMVCCKGGPSPGGEGGGNMANPYATRAYIAPHNAFKHSDDQIPTGTPPRYLHQNSFW